MKIPVTMSTSSTNLKRTRVLQLYCSDLEITVDNYIITPSMTHEDIMARILASFRKCGVNQVFPRDINGE
jgi:hypothetical protein